MSFYFNLYGPFAGLSIREYRPTEFKINKLLILRIHLLENRFLN
jgi:hypothetical protein